MAQITLRLPEEIQEMLKYEAIRLGKSQNTVVTDVLTKHLGKNRYACSVKRFSGFQGCVAKINLQSSPQTKVGQ